jgi:hypothetical protein
MTDLVILTLVRIALCAAVSWLVWRYLGLVVAVITVPLWGVALARPILEFSGHFYDWLNRSPLAEWQGRYYSFNGVHLRVFPVEQALWIVDRDIFKVLGEKPTLLLPDQFGATEYGAIEGTPFHGFSEAGLERLLTQHPHSESARLLVWLRREVYFPHRRKMNQPERREDLLKP